MKITIIGASAGVGLAATRLALERGHAVTTLSRRTESLPDHPRLRKVSGSSTDLANVEAVLDGADAILVTIGTGTSTKATTLYSGTARVLVQALRKGPAAAPLIVLTGFGAGESWGYNSVPMKILFNLFLRKIYADKTEMERIVTGGCDRWEIVRPGRLTDGPLTQRYRVLDRLGDGMRVGAISRADVAHFMVAEAERPAHLRQYVALTG